MEISNQLANVQNQTQSAIYKQSQDEKQQKPEKLKRVSLNNKVNISDKFKRAKEEFFSSGIYKNNQNVAYLGENSVSPYGRVLTSYVSKEEYVLGNGERISFSNIDESTDSQIPGRFAINGGISFFQQAAQLFSKDARFLTDERSWLHKDIDRYVNDIANFFNASDVGNLKEQVNNYIQYLAGVGDKREDELEFTIDGISFSTEEFVSTVSFIKDTLHPNFNVSEVSGKQENLRQKVNLEQRSSNIINYISKNLTQEQQYIISNSKNHWMDYSLWSNKYAHDENLFAYK